MRLAHIILSVSLLFISQIALAEQKISVGKHDLHYNTFPSTFLSKEVAATYQITRSKNRGILSISVIDTSQTPTIAVEADIEIIARNLLNQNKDVKLTKIVESNTAIYYLGSFSLNDQEDVNFSITAKPKGSEQVLSVEFSREFFTD